MKTEKYFILRPITGFYSDTRFETKEDVDHSLSAEYVRLREKRAAGIMTKENLEYWMGLEYEIIEVIKITNVVSGIITIGGKDE